MIPSRSTAITQKQKKIKRYFKTIRCFILNFKSPEYLYIHIQKIKLAKQKDNTSSNEEKTRKNNVSENYKKINMFIYTPK